jgi:hypothetical protein
VWTNRGGPPTLSDSAVHRSRRDCRGDRDPQESLPDAAAGLRGAGVDWEVSADGQHPTYWQYASGESSPLPDVISDGPDVKFHQSKLNFKWSKDGDEVKWHQDISFWPHTNCSPCTAGTYVFDCAADQGRLGLLPGSHTGRSSD